MRLDVLGLFTLIIIYIQLAQKVTPYRKKRTIVREPSRHKTLLTPLLPQNGTQKAHVGNHLPTDGQGKALHAIFRQVQHRKLSDEGNYHRRQFILTESF